MVSFEIDDDLPSRREMFTYAAEKRAFINTVLLLKVILIGAGITEEPVFWIDEREKEEWEQSELLTDWGELFTMGIRGIKQPLRETKFGTSVNSRSELTLSSFCNWRGFDFSNANVSRSVFYTVMMNDVVFNYHILRIYGRIFLWSQYDRLLSGSVLDGEPASKQDQEL